jgi:hypothetical protein
MSRAAAPLAVLVAVAVALLTGCDRSPALIAPRPTGYHPDRFPDIRLPAGYVLRADQDQLAVTYAGGSLRRFDVSLVAKPDNTKATPDEAMAWFDRVLPSAGWKPAGQAAERERHWRKPTPTGETEELVVETGRYATRAVVHVRLEPAR